MDLVEAGAGARAICRECGAAIRVGEARFGRALGASEGRRMRWRHLACAAQAMPTALLRALERGGWRSVPDADHDELRALILGARRRPLREDSEALELGAARSSSAMAAAAVLEPAHEAEALSPERARAFVLADTLQARGDPRGELLALELAAEHTHDPAHARSLQREHHACWGRFERELEASKQLRLRWVGGFLLGAHPQAHTQLHALLRTAAAGALERLRFDFCTQDELEQLVPWIQTHARSLVALELRHSRHRSLAPLAELTGLELLRVGERFDGAWLGRLPRLRGLSLSAGATLEPDELASATKLELVELDAPHPDLIAGLAAGATTLRGLRLGASKSPLPLAGLAALSRLERLDLLELPLRDLAALHELHELRELGLCPGTMGTLDGLAGLTGLERLALRGSKVAELDGLDGLERLTHLALLGTRSTKLSRLRRLPRLRSLVIEGGDMRRIHGLERLRGLEQLGLSKLANLDLTALEPLEHLDTLVLLPGGGRPRQLESLAKLPRLRRLSAPLELLEPLAKARAALREVEVLELHGAGLPTQGLLDGLPRLRRLLLPDRNPSELAQLAARNPELAVFGELPRRDHLDRSDPFDWRELGWLPRAEAGPGPAGAGTQPLVSPA